MSSGFPFSLAPPNRLRRSVVDPETGNAVVTSGAADEAHPDPNAITSRSWLLPLGRTASGAVVPAAQAPVKFVGDLGKAVVGSIPDAVPQAIDAVKWIGDIAAGRKGVFDPTTGHVSDEALGNAFGAAGVAMTGSMPLKAPKGALRSFGGAAAKDDSLAALEAGLAANLKGIAPEGRPVSFVDPNAKSWDVYHGTNSPVDFARFDTSLDKAMRPHTPDGEAGAVFLTPAPAEAAHYAGDLVGKDSTPGAGPRIIRATVEPGRTGLLDIPALLENDPAFVAKARENFLRDAKDWDAVAAEGVRTGNPKAVEQAKASTGALFDERHARMLDEFRSARDLNAQLTEMGYPATEVPQAQWGYGATAAAIQRAREQGLDTAVLRGLSESNGGDQVVALTPGRVRSFYSPDHLLYSGGRGGGPAGAAALALPGEDRATPSNAQEKTMSAGALPGFGLIPNAGPDDLRRLLRLMPLDPSQGVPIMDAGGTPGAEEPHGLQGQMPRAPSPPGGLLDMADLTGPAGAQIHHPGTAKPGGLQSAIAMDEADTQRLEQQTGMMPPAPATGGLLSELFGKAPMGAPQSFSGTSGTVMPGQGPDLSGSPMPPARPSAADLAAPAPAARPLGFGSLAPPRPARPQQADMPAPVAVPVAGQTPQAAPTTPGAGPAAIPSAAPAAPGSAPPGTPGAEEPSFLDKVSSGFRRFSENGGGDLLGSIGMGLMSTPGFGQGLAAGLKNHQALEEKRAVTDLAKAEFGLKQRKITQEALGNNLTYQSLVRKGVSAEDAQAAIAASLAGHGEALSNLLNNNFRKVPDAPSGFTMGPDGNMRAIPGGPADPATKRADAQATAEGGEAGKAAAPFNLSEGQTRYDGDGKPIVSAPSKKPDGFDVETKLRGEFNKGLGTFQDVHDGYGRVIAATRQRQANPNGVSPASDIGLIFGYMKMLDPGSVVREGEYATAANAAGIPDRVRNAYNKAMQGEFLTPDQRQDFIGQAGELYGTARKGAEAVAGRYRNLAGQYGVDPDRTTFLPEAPQAPTVGRNRMQPGASAPARQFGPIPGPAAQALQRDPRLREQFDAKYGAGAADMFLRGR